MGPDETLPLHDESMVAHFAALASSDGARYGLLMQSANALLFTPFRLGALELSNRIVMAPMTRNQSPGGVPGDDVVGYYRRRAEHGVGLIITEGTAIEHPASASGPRVPSFFGADALAGWAKVARAVHAAGGRIMPQLWHVGATRKLGSEPNPDAAPIGPSGLDLNGNVVNEPLTEAAVSKLIDAYANAAADALRLGFDGIELHGAHGYLIDQFFWDRTNRRADRYGGDLVARTRFAVEVIKACRRHTTPDFPIVLRFSQWKLADYDAKLARTPEELARFLAPLVDASVDAFHCSTRRSWTPEFEGSQLNLAGWARKLSGKPTITVGSVGLDAEFTSSLREGKPAGNARFDTVLEMLDRGEVDLVAVGRALLVDPAWAEKIREERYHDLIPFTPEALKTLS
jgi:2,4-dienoyl-CoA reductase-like NADH-dependent reductase (Old Yellow Enzyme family)